ncbi:hypothetical protein C8J56DRAFT_1156888 [Mycena floridula]|nr:hypothetical protein C8J56DRAFT_1156888 [Mycena floridula]
MASSIKQAGPLDIVPLELWRICCSEMDVGTLASLAQSNKAFVDVVQEQLFMHTIGLLGRSGPDFYRSFGHERHKFAGLAANPKVCALIQTSYAFGQPFLHTSATGPLRTAYFGALDAYFGCLPHFQSLHSIVLCDMHVDEAIWRKLGDLSKLTTLSLVKCILQGRADVNLPLHTFRCEGLTEMSSDCDIEQLFSPESIQVLTLTDPEVASRWLTHRTIMPEFSALTKFEICPRDIYDSQLVTMLQKCPKLSDLTVTEPPKSSGVFHLPNEYMPHLLHFSGPSDFAIQCEAIAGREIQSIRFTPYGQITPLSEMQETLEHLASPDYAFSQTALRHLDIAVHPSLPDSEYELDQRFPQLESLSILVNETALEERIPVLKIITPCNEASEHLDDEERDAYWESFEWDVKHLPVRGKTKSQAEIEERIAVQRFLRMLDPPEILHLEQPLQRTKQRIIDFMLEEDREQKLLKTSWAPLFALIRGKLQLPPGLKSFTVDREFRKQSELYLTSAKHRATLSLCKIALEVTRKTNQQLEYISIYGAQWEV